MIVLMTFQVDSPGTVLISTLLDILALDILGSDILGLDILGLDILGCFRQNRHGRRFHTHLCEGCILAVESYMWRQFKEVRVQVDWHRFLTYYRALKYLTENSL